MIGVVAKIVAKEGHEQTLEDAFRTAVAQVKANEPGNKMYQLTKSRTEPRTYKVMEIYTDQAALEAHGQSDHYKALGRTLRDAVEGRPEVELLDTVD